MRAPEFVGAHRSLGRAFAAGDALRAMHRMLEIPTIDVVDLPRFFRREAAALMPALLPGFTEKWTAPQKWSLDFFEASFGEVSIDVIEGRSSMPDDLANVGKNPTEMSIAELVQKIRSVESSNDFYALAQNRNIAKDDLRALFDDCEMPEGMPPIDTIRRGSALWFGPEGTVTPLHHDSSNIFFVQIVGRKHIKMISPFEWEVGRQSKGVYAMMDPESEDWKRDPELSEVKVHDFELGPGETLFIPAGWWHHVRALSPSVSIAINALPFDNKFRALLRIPQRYGT